MHAFYGMIECSNCYCRQPSASAQCDPAGWALPTQQQLCLRGDAAMIYTLQMMASVG
jgi:hypothetical protein